MLVQNEKASPDDEAHLPIKSNFTGVSAVQGLQAQTTSNANGQRILVPERQQFLAQRAPGQPPTFVQPNAFLVEQDNL